MDCFAALAMTGEGCFMPPLTLPVIARSAATKIPWGVDSDQV